MKIRHVLNRAMEKMLQDKNNNLIKNQTGILKIKPFDFGKGTENSSEEIDKILYEA